MNIVEKIKELCYEHGISVAYLERELDFSRGSITKWSKSSPSINKIQIVANYFQITPNELILGTDSYTFGGRLKAIRRKRELLQRELADKIGCSEKAISSYERNYRTPDVQTINKLSTHLNISVDYLINGTKDMDQFIIEDSSEYPIDNQNNLADVYSLLNKYSNRFTKEQGNDLKDLIEWYIDKNIK